jgi:hypothetical protein
MSERALATAQKQSTAPAAPSHGAILQREFAYGNHAKAGGEYAECSKTTLGLQRKLTIGASSDPLELEADRVAEAVVSGRSVATRPGTGPLAVQRQEMEKPREQPQFPAQETSETEKLQKGGLAAAGEFFRRFWDQFSNSEEGKRILAKNERDLQPILKFFKDFADSIFGKTAPGAGGSAAAKSGRDTSSNPVNSPSTAGPAPYAAKDEKLFSLELKWDFVTPPSGMTLKTPWLDSPEIPLGPTPSTPTPAPPKAPLPFKMAPKIPRICTPADPQGDQGEADARSAFIFWWLQQNQQAAEKRAQEILDQSKLREPPKFAPSVLKPLFKREPGAEAISDPQIVEAGLRSPGEPLDPATRAFMEPRFGYDFSHVRVHTDSKAVESARALNAMAYTFGRDVVFGPGKFAPASPSGQRLIAHELAHVVQQSGADGTRELQRQQTAGPAATPSAQPVGDAIKPEIEGLLKAFASASGTAAKNAIAMQAVQMIIRAYGISTKGINAMRFNPNLKPSHSGETGTVEGNKQASEIEFGPSAFDEGFEWLVHVVAHEVEHVRQNLIGTYHRGNEDEPVSEFLAYNSMVLQVQTVPAPAGKGFLGGLIAGAGKGPPALPALPPERLASMAERALLEFGKMPAADQQKYRPELASARDKLFDRLKNEAPRALRPPAKYSPEWAGWYDDQIPTSDPFTMEFLDWSESRKSPWVKVKAIWKQFDAAFKIH